MVCREILHRPAHALDMKQTGPGRANLSAMVRLPAGYHLKAGGWRGSPATGTRVRRIARPGQEQYTRLVTAPIDPSYSQVPVNGAGTAQLSLGPSGVGNKWHPQSIAIATSTGAADSSTCSIYIGPLPIGSLFGGQSYAGGGDTIGTPGVEMQPGDQIWALWTGATPGATATLVVYGDMDALDRG